MLLCGEPVRTDVGYTALTGPGDSPTASLGSCARRARSGGVGQERQAKPRCREAEIGHALKQLTVVGTITLLAMTTGRPRNTVEREAGSPLLRVLLDGLRALTYVLPPRRSSTCDDRARSCSNPSGCLASTPMTSSSTTCRATACSQLREPGKG